MLSVFVRSSRVVMEIRQNISGFMCLFFFFLVFVMMFLVAIWDYKVNDVWVTLFFVALNVVLFFLFL